MMTQQLNPAHYQPAFGLAVQRNRFPNQPNDAPGGTAAQRPRSFVVQRALTHVSLAAGSGVFDSSARRLRFLEATRLSLSGAWWNLSMSLVPRAAAALSCAEQHSFLLRRAFRRC